MLVVPAALEAESGGLQIRGQTVQLSETLTQNKTKHPCVKIIFGFNYS